MRQLSEYKKVDVNTADSVKIVSMLFEGVINFIRTAKKRMEDGDIAGKGLYIGKATAIVGELSSSLNMEAGEIAINLRRLYDFVLERLLQANLKSDPKALEDAEKILNVLGSGWKEMERGLSKSSDLLPKVGNNVGMELRV